ncbi:MAG TPA: helix-turn-helix domain-containing protein [Caulobacteraceae bacterium]|nr:helix-turn-helix domain-containing protein [Caulobacteraceae bacterium]
MSFILGQTLAAGEGALPMLFAVGGVASCGWSWLLTRALFDRAEQDARWPRIVVAVVWLTGGASIVTAPGSDLVASTMSNGYALSGSAALLMTFVEPLQGFRRSLPSAETRFRIAFLAVYGLLVTCSILLLRETGEGDAGAIKSACAVVGVAAAGGAVWFRKRHPLPVGEATPSRRPATADDRLLAERILEVLQDEELYVSPDLKVADLARRLAAPEHRVTRSITAASGFPNFNRLVNHHRVERAKRMLSDPALGGRPILLVAFDCGFASVGPFNRAFKAETGLAPRAYRNLHVRSGDFHGRRDS